MGRALIVTRAAIFTLGLSGMLLLSCEKAEAGDPLADLLDLTAGHVHFDSSAPLVSQVQTTRVSADTTVTFQPVAETSCTRWWAGRGCLEREFVIKTNGRPFTDVVTDADFRLAMIHELAHVYDGMDDGLFNGSPGHPYAPGRYGQHDHCNENNAEFYACEVTRTGRVR